MADSIEAKDTARDPDGVANMATWLESLPPEWQELFEEMKRRRAKPVEARE